MKLLTNFGNYPKARTVMTTVVEMKTAVQKGDEITEPRAFISELCYLCVPQDCISECHNLHTKQKFQHRQFR